MSGRKPRWPFQFVSVLILLPVALLGLCLLHPAMAAEAKAQTPVMAEDGDEAHECSLATLNGSYGIIEQGTFLFSPPIPGVPTAPFPAVNNVLATFDGKGNDSGKWTASFGGVIVAGTFTGKYTVKSDCTLTIDFTAAPLGASFTEIGTITGHGPFQEIHLMYTTPGMVATGTGKRIPEHGCSLATLRGNYDVFGQGAVMAPIPGVNAPPPIFLSHSGVFTSDGAGHFVGHHTESVDGVKLEESFTATYTLNPDCTVTAAIDTPNRLVYEIGTIVAHGEYRGIITNPGWVVVETARLTADNDVKTWAGPSSGTAEIVGKCEDGSLSFVESGAGYLKPIGAFTWSNKYCMDPVTWKGSGGAIITTANGDEIRVKTNPQFTWTSAGGGTWIETEIVVSGTGRFDDAMGFTESGGTFTLTSPTTAVWQGVSKGVLSY